MSSESIVDAAFSGFRLVRRRPRILAFWTAIELVFGLASGIFFVWAAGGALTQLADPSSQGERNPYGVFAMLGQIVPAYLVLIVAWMLNYAIFLAAANRALSRPEESRFGYLRFGPDELRQFGLVACLILLGAGLYLAVMMVAAVAIALTVAMSGGGRHIVEAGPATIASALVTFLAVLLGFAALVFFWVRLSLASPITFATGKINVFGSWSLTRGRFWSILGVQALVLLFIIGISAVGYVLIFAITGLTGEGSTMATLFKPDISSVSAYLSPARLVATVLQTALSALILPVSLCPVVDIYRRIAGPSSVAAVFS
jgi:hypothetical protein